MKTWRSLVLVVAVACVGALGTLAAGAVAGMPASDLAQLLIYLAPAIVVTAFAALLAGRLLARVSSRQRMLAVVLVAPSVALTNLAVLTRDMFVSKHDATVLVVLIAYGIGAGVGAALVVSRASTRVLRDLTGAATRLGEGDLGVRVDTVPAGPDMDALADALDHMAAQLQEAQERERRGETARRDLITAVSHDLRTPLSSLRAMIEAIDERIVEDRPTMRRYAGEMRSSIGQLVGMVDNLFELAQLDSGAIEHEAERIRLDDAVHSALAAVELQARQKGLRVLTRLGDAGEDPCSPRLVRVLQNLLSNAVRHTPADGTILIGASREVDRLIVAVEDDGEGIAPGDLDRVFEPFYRSDRARTGASSGLGLSLAQRIVKSLGGSIEVKSTPARGSRFAISLPR